ncbi:hypothetical protein LCGC14_1188780, partial [marine sediment metagenome]
MSENNIDEISIPIYDTYDDFKDLLEILDKINIENKDDYFNEATNQIFNIFQLIPEINELLITQLRNKIKSITKIPFGKFDTIINERRAEIKQEEKESQNVNTQTESSVLDSNIETIPFDDNKIVITSDKVTLLYDNKPPQTILNSKIEVLSILFDERKGENLYTLKIGNITYPYHTLNDIIRELGNSILRGTIGKDVISYLIIEKSKGMHVRKGKYILGWNNGWWIPIKKDEEDKDFGIICYSEEQQTVYNNCKKMYKKYSLNKKKEIKLKLQEFVKKTDMPEAYKTIIISCCIINPFRLYFIKNFGIFPHLALYGRTTAGKTSMLDSWSTDFYKNRLKHMSGKNASSPSQIEGAMTGSTFPTMVDDYKETNSYNTALMEMILKDPATGIPFWKRLNRDGIRFRAREIVSSVLTTSQALGELMNDSALIARTISLPYNEPIVSNDDWIRLELELKEEKLFSLMYDFTGNWTDKDLDKLMKKVNEKYKYELKCIPINTDLNYPKLIKIYKIILVGHFLVNKIYGTDLKINDVWDVLVKVRRKTVSTFLEHFIDYCNFARNLDEEKPIPKKLNYRMEYDVKRRVYLFESKHLSDFSLYYSGFNNDRIKFNLNSLFERANDALKYKLLIKLSKIDINSGRRKCIQISPVLIHSGDNEPTKGIERMSNILSINTSIEPEHRENAIRGITPQDVKIEFENMGETFEIPDHNSSTG